MSYKEQLFCDKLLIRPKHGLPSILLVTTRGEAEKMDMVTSSPPIPSGRTICPFRVFLNKKECGGKKNYVLELCRRGALACMALYPVHGACLRLDIVLKSLQ